eukprot:CAMPEP_0185749662 /NCGR_PEP_ID=MMETSP1174-20130828/8359_1 /TAXON_ID=35687 /ORGANISM="Dictyocha speculum, Strain CCMP1381" /LENGTH=73 /DNA_ID=CAMNT_0028425865 /DNA_START=364 /DNA_END=585 /DNA_ORIENTATION=+
MLDLVYSQQLPEDQRRIPEENLCGVSGGVTKESGCIESGCIIDPSSVYEFKSQNSMPWSVQAGQFVNVSYTYG